MKKNILIASLCAMCGLFIYLLLEKGKYHDANTGVPTQVAANDDSVKSHKAQYLFIIDSLNKDIKQQDVIIKDLLSGQEQYKGEANKWAKEAKTLAVQVKAGNKDTTLNAKIDSLVSVVNNLTFSLVQYEVYTDSLNRVNAALQANYEAKDIEKEKRLTELQAAYDNLLKAYQSLFADSNDLRKDLKKQKLKTKVVGVLGAAAAILGLIK